MENSYHSFVWNEYKNRPRMSEKWLGASGGPDLPGSERMEQWPVEGGERYIYEGGLHSFHGTPEVETRVSGWNIQGGQLVIKMERAALGGNHGLLTFEAPT